MDERASKRVAVDKEIECRVGGRSARVLLYNLSVGGCMIETSNGLVSEGDWASLKLSDTILAGGVVIWQIGRNAGIRFEQALHGAIVEFLGFKPSIQSFDHAWPRDRFGRPLPELKTRSRETPRQF